MNMRRKTDIHRRDVLVGAGATAFTVGCAHKIDDYARPDIIFIMADDLGYADIGCYGGDHVETPNIDQLADKGMLFTDAYANSSVCSPTRLALITGQYQYRYQSGLDEPLSIVSKLGLEPGVQTLPRFLGDAGYRTSLIGKWHLGFPAKFSPLKHGYDRFWGLRSGGIDYFTHSFEFMGTSTHDLWDGDAEIDDVGYLTNLITDKAVDEINLAIANSDPYYMSLHFTAPHWPWQTEDRADVGRPITSLDFEGGSLSTYKKMIENMDRNIGRVIDAVKKGGRSENTIIVFTSDNGGERFSRTWPFNGKKGELLEGGIRTPLIVKWPTIIAKGLRTSQQAISMDWVPTLLSAAGVVAPTSMGFDGVDLMPTLSDGIVLNRKLFWRHYAYNQQAARIGDWKFLKIDDAEYLFDVTVDPMERANKKNIEPEMFAALKSEFLQWNKDMLPYPDGTPSWDNKRESVFADRY